MSLSVERSSDAGGRRWLLLLFWLAAVAAVALAGSWATLPKIPTWYAGLVKPSFTPPNSVFGPVWSVLYGMMAVAAWLVWRRKSAPSRQTALALFVVQLGLNALWSWLFFKWRLGLFASIEVVLLWLGLVATVIAFFRATKLAGALMLPYLAWVSFATVLTVTVWRLNPASL